MAFGAENTFEIEQLEEVTATKTVVVAWGAEKERRANTTKVLTWGYTTESNLGLHNEGLNLGLHNEALTWGYTTELILL